MAAEPTPHGPWKCFHCWEVFHNPTQAAMHFGATPDAEPMCRVPRKDWPLAYAYRELEQELARYRAEDSDKDRELSAMQDEHARALRRAEEAGYERGLRDGMQLKERA